MTAKKQVIEKIKEGEGALPPESVSAVSSDFHNNWKKIISNEEKDLVLLLLVESDKIIAKIDFEIQWHIKYYHLNNYHREYELLQKKTQ